MTEEVDAVISTKIIVICGDVEAVMVSVGNTCTGDGHGDHSHSKEMRERL